MSNVGVVCNKRAMMRRASQSSDTMEHPREGVGDQEPHYFTFEVSWEVANKGMSCEIFAISLIGAGRIGAYIRTPPNEACNANTMAFPSFDSKIKVLQPLGKSYHTSCDRSF